MNNLNAIARPTIAGPPDGRTYPRPIAHLTGVVECGLITAAHQVGPSRFAKLTFRQAQQIEVDNLTSSIMEKDSKMQRRRVSDIGFEMLRNANTFQQNR